MKLVADVSGPQRKLLDARVAPLRRSHGDAGILLRNGKTLPFVVERRWSAPAGHYAEQWFLVHPETREVFFEGPSVNRLIWGLQAPTDVVDEIREEIPLPAGKYLVVFALGGQMGGDIEVEASEGPAEEAA